MSELLAVRNLTIGMMADQGFVPIVDRLNFNIAQGQTVGLVGESGSGKSMAAKSIMGLLGHGLHCQQGEIIFTDRTGAQKDVARLKTSGREIRQLRGAEIAMIFQEPMASLSPVHTIGDQIMTTLRQHSDLSREAAKARVIELLHEVGMASPRAIANQYPHHISGGMRQRAMIAMALSCQPRLLICDEPTTALDVTTEAQIMELLQGLQQRFGMAILFISHNIALVSEIADQLLVMYLGQIVEGGPSADVLQQPQHPYTRALLASLPARVEPGERLATISGSVPEVTQRPSGCQFHPRCAERLAERCDAEDPQQGKLIIGHQAWCHRHD